MIIHDDAPGRIVLVLGEDPGTFSGAPFDTRTRAGAWYLDSIGTPAGDHFASAYIVPAARQFGRASYGRHARVALASRRVIVVGREAASLLVVPDVPVMRWSRSEAMRIDAFEFPPLDFAAFPVLWSTRNGDVDIERVEQAVGWLAEQGGVV